MRKKYENVKESFGMGEGLHFAQVEKKAKHSKYKDCGFQGDQPLGGVRRIAPAEQLLRINVLLACFFMLTSCEKEDAFAIQCIGNDCQSKSAFPICIDEHNLLISDDPTISPVFCPNGCLNDQCVPDNQECAEGTSQCLSDLLLQTCVYGKWMTQECQDLCDDGKCIDQPVLCIDGERRCSDSDVEVCVNGGWTVQETCPLGCSNGSCTQGCSEPDYCQDSATLMQCIGDNWIPVACRNGCYEGKCKPDVHEEVDHRLTNQLCSEDEEGDPGICDYDFQTNELGGVCVDAGPYAYYCFARCDPYQPIHNYYCMESFAAIQGDCRQISDGSYAIIPTHVDICEYSDCSPQTGCSTISDSYEIPPSYCDHYENYCEGTIVHECTNQMEVYDCREYGDKICVQFWSNIHCASPCEVEGEVYYECSPGYNMMYSTAVTCVPDDNGVLSWQYNHGVTNECPNGCDNATGLCK